MIFYSTDGTSTSGTGSGAGYRIWSRKGSQATDTGKGPMTKDSWLAHIDARAKDKAGDACASKAGMARAHRTGGVSPGAGTPSG